MWLGAVALPITAVGCTALLGLEDLSGPEDGSATGSGGTSSGQPSQAASAGGAGGHGGNAIATAGPGGAGGGVPSCNGTPTPIAEGEPDIGRIAVSGTHAFWTIDDGSSIRLRTAPKDGSGTPVDVDGYDDGARADAVAALEDRVCWAQHREPVRIACKVGGGPIEYHELPEGDVVQIVDLAIARGRVFVVTDPPHVYEVETTDPQTVDEVTLITGDAMSFAAIDGTASLVCMAQSEPPALRCIDPDTTDDAGSVTGFVGPSDVALGQQGLIFVADPLSDAVMVTQIPSAGVTVMAATQLQLGPIVADVDDVYWIAANPVGAGRVVQRLGQTSLPDLQQPMLSGLLEPVGLAVDEEAVYVSDRATGTVLRCSK